MAAAGAVVGQTLIRRLAALGLWIAQSERGPIARRFLHPFERRDLASSDW